jgi:hypothetical protein
MGKLREPGQQARAEPGEEKEHGFAGGEAGGETVPQQQSDGEGDAEQVVIVQIRTGERGEDEDDRH